MFSLILRFGLIGGVIVVTPMFILWSQVKAGDPHPPGGMLITYLTMLVALTMVFVGIKQYRDKIRGGVVKFFPAFGVGLAISAVASVLYAASWEIVTAMNHFDFTAWWSNEIVKQARAAGKSSAETAAEVQAFVAMYGNPWKRVPLVFMEMFPVGILVSAIAAGVLRNSRILPARAT
jgi:hypothetical protein